LAEWERASDRILWGCDTSRNVLHHLGKCFEANPEILQRARILGVFIPVLNQFNMCFKIDCSSCKKPTWSVCGKHIDSVSGLDIRGTNLHYTTACEWLNLCNSAWQALSSVPVENRCKCKPCTQKEADLLGWSSQSIHAYISGWDTYNIFDISYGNLIVMSWGC
jgi:hypothetical protein